MVIWLRSGDRRLGDRARGAIESSLLDYDVAYSAISLWEIAMRVQKRQIDFRQDLVVWRRSLREQGFIELAVDGRVALRAGLLPDLHGDPADRLIVATAMEGHQLVTADRRILEWPGRLETIAATE